MALSIGGVSTNNLFPVSNAELIRPANPVKSAPSPLEVGGQFEIDNGLDTTRFTPSINDFLEPPTLYTRQGFLNEPVSNSQFENSTASTLSNLQNRTPVNTQETNNLRLASLSTTYDLLSPAESPLGSSTAVETLA